MSDQLKSIYSALTPLQHADLLEQARRNIIIREACQNFFEATPHSEPVQRFIQKAKAALERVGRVWYEVLWDAVDKEYFDDEPDKLTALKVISFHSPTKAALSSKDREVDLAKAVAFVSAQSDLSIGDELGDVQDSTESQPRASSAFTPRNVRPKV